MKKVISLLVLLVAFTSCEENVKFNDPAVQGLKDNVSWKAVDYKATRGLDNSLTIEATNGYETLVLITASIEPGTYQLGVDESSKASFVFSDNGEEMAFQTGEGKGDGAIIISMLPDRTDIEQGFITGEFNFNAVDDLGNVVNFDKGVFYKIPITTAQ